MKFTLKNTSGQNLLSLMRATGYRYVGRASPDAEKKQLSFVRPVGLDPYPRFHIYLEENPAAQEIHCSLHLDQRKPIYQGAPAHSADYESEVIKKEVQRIKECLR